MFESLFHHELYHALRSSWSGLPLGCLGRRRCTWGPHCSCALKWLRTLFPSLCLATPVRYFGKCERSMRNRRSFSWTRQRHVRDGRLDARSLEELSNLRFACYVLIPLAEPRQVDRIECYRGFLCQLSSAVYSLTQVLVVKEDTNEAVGVLTELLTAGWTELQEVVEYALYQSGFSR